MTGAALALAAQWAALIFGAIVAVCVVVFFGHGAHRAREDDYRLVPPMTRAPMHPERDSSLTVHGLPLMPLPSLHAEVARLSARPAEGTTTKHEQEDGRA